MYTKSTDDSYPNQQMMEYLIEVHGFEAENITLLMDDGEHTDPTRANILAAYEELVNETEGTTIQDFYSRLFYSWICGILSGM